MAKSKHPASPGGVYAALATPRRPHSVEADAAVFLDYLDTIVRAGVDGLVLFGSTGEFIHFDVGERMRVLSLAIRRSRVPVLVNVSHSTLAGAVELAENAFGLGAAGVLLMPPYFYCYTDPQLFEFYRQFAEMLGARGQMFLYNLPSSTTAISGELARRLFETGDFAGIKDSSGDWLFFETLRELRGRTSFTLLSGSEALYVRSRLGGAAGIVSGVAAALPELMVALDRAIRAEDRARAERLDERLQQFLAWIDRFPTTIGIKQAAVARGWKLNHFPFRFDDDTQADLAGFHHWLREWLPVVLAECAEAAAVQA